MAGNKRKTATSTALRNKAEAKRLRAAAHALEAPPYNDPLGADIMRHDAGELEQEADASLTLETKPNIGTGGELVPTEEQPGQVASLIDTVEQPDAATSEASMERLQLALEVDAAGLAVDAAETIQARNSLEKMLAHQMAAAHKLAMEFAGHARRLSEDAAGDIYERRQTDSVEAARAANASARMMDSFQKGLLALAKVRTGGRQTVTVQHVNVNDGGQAVVTGGIKTGDNRERCLICGR